MWSTGYFTVGNVELYYEVKHYEEGSGYGINGGRISKLVIRLANSKKTLASYDRGWDVRPGNTAARKAYERLLKKYN